MKTSISLISLVCIPILASCVTSYDGPAEGVETADIWFTRNIDGVKNKNDYLQGYDIVPAGQNDFCNGTDSLARFSGSNQFEKTTKVEANKPLTVFAHSADYTGQGGLIGEAYKVCYSQFTFIPTMGHRYQVTHLGSPYDADCKPYIIDLTTQSTPQDLVVETNMTCKSW